MIDWRGVRAVAMLLAMGVAAGCADPSLPPESHRYLGVLQMVDYVGATEASDSAERPLPESWSHPPEDLDLVPPRVIAIAADTLTAGAPVDITTYTVGGGCTVADGQEVTISGRVVELKPYDREVGEVCTLQLVYVPHTSTVTFQEPGEWIVRVSGRRVRYQDSTWELPISAEVVVQVY